MQLEQAKKLTEDFTQEDWDAVKIYCMQARFANQPLSRNLRQLFPQAIQFAHQFRELKKECANSKSQNTSRAYTSNPSRAARSDGSGTKALNS